jgi:hypothetical protein
MMISPSSSRKHVQAIKAIPLARPKIEGGYTRDDFVVDHEARTVACPAGHAVTITPKGTAAFGTRCRDCPLRRLCTTAKDGRTLRVSDHDDELVAARRQWNDKTFMDDYRQYRPMVERSIAWIVTNGHRRVRYRGIEANRTQLALRIAAINLRRLVNLGLNHNGEAWAIT